MGKRFFASLVGTLVALVLLALPGCSAAGATVSATSSIKTTSSTTTQASTTTSTQVATTTTATATTVAGREIRIGVMGGMSGAAGSAVTPMFKELENLIKYINEVRGGIDGARIVYRIVDNKGTPDGAIQAYKELRDTYHPQIYIAVEDYLLAGLKDTFAQDKSVILCTSAIMPNNYMPAGRLFATAPPGADTVAAFVRWMKQDWKGTGKPKLGIVYRETASGPAFETARSWIESQGVEIVSAGFEATALDMKPALLKMREANVDYIYSISTVTNNTVLIHDYRALGMTMPFCFNEYDNAHQLLPIAGDQAEGFMTLSYESPYSTGSEAAKLWAAAEKYATGEDRWADNRTILLALAVATEGSKLAAAKVGWDKVTNNDIFEALKGATVVDTWGDCNNLGYGPDKRLGINSIVIKQYTKTATLAISDWIELPRCFEGIDK